MQSNTALTLMISKRRISFFGHSFEREIEIFRKHKKAGKKRSRGMQIQSCGENE